MAMSNAWYRAVHRDFDSEVRRFGGDLGRVRPSRIPRDRTVSGYYFADQIVTIRDRQDFVARVSGGNHSERVAFVQRPAFVPARGVVTSWSETSNTAVIDVEAAGTAFLVMSVTPHKYWRVTIDGVRTEAVGTNVG